MAHQGGLTEILKMDADGVLQTNKDITLVNDFFVNDITMTGSLHVAQMDVENESFFNSDVEMIHDVTVGHNLVVGFAPANLNAIPQPDIIPGGALIAGGLNVVGSSGMIVLGNVQFGGIVPGSILPPTVSNLLIHGEIQTDGDIHSNANGFFNGNIDIAGAHIATAGVINSFGTITSTNGNIKSTLGNIKGNSFKFNFIDTKFITLNVNSTPLTTNQKIITLTSNGNLPGWSNINNFFVVPISGIYSINFMDTMIGIALDNFDILIQIKTINGTISGNAIKVNVPAGDVINHSIQWTGFLLANDNIEFWHGYLTAPTGRNIALIANITQLFTQ